MRAAGARAADSFVGRLCRMQAQDCQDSFITKATKNHKGHKGNWLIG